jgi:glycosyltransferase involved in cell wall biosynthesis
MARNLAHHPRLRVLHLARDAGYGGIGGAEILVLEFARRLDPQRFESFLCTTRRPEPDRAALAAREAAELERGGVRVLNLDRASSRSLVPWSRLWWLLVRERIDVVHAHMPRANVPGALLARGARVPVVVGHEHGSVRYADPMRRLLNRTVVGPLSDAVLAVSDWDRRRLVAEQGLPASRVRVFRNGILPLPDDVDDVRPELADPGVPIVGALGRLDPVKGYDTLIEAVARLRASEVRLRCVIAGVGPDEARLRGLIRERGVEGEVVLLGLRDDVPALLRAFDVAVMSSRSEGAPLAIIEYMAAGLPIIATRVGGIPELIEPEVHGILVAPDDPEALAAGVRRVLEHPDRAAELAAAARTRQQAEFDLDVVVGRLEDLYLSLYDSRRARRRRRRAAQTAARSG